MTVMTDPLSRRIAAFDALPGVGLALTRVATALIFLYHGWPKATDWAMATEKFVGFGLPGALGPVVGILEVVFGLTLLLGVWTRVSAVVLGVIIVVALVAVQMPKGVTAGLERDAMLLAATVLLAALGPGLWAIDREVDAA